MTTIHVAVDGTVTYGRPVRETASNRPWCRKSEHAGRGRHTDAFPPNVPPTAHGNRYREDFGIPGNRREAAAILGVTVPHSDCSTHLPGGGA